MWGPPPRRHREARRLSQTPANYETGRLTPCWSSILEKEEDKSEGQCLSDRLLGRRGPCHHRGCPHCKFISRVLIQKNQPIWGLAIETSSALQPPIGVVQEKPKGSGLKYGGAWVLLYNQSQRPWWINLEYFFLTDHCAGHVRFSPPDPCPLLSTWWGPENRPLWRALTGSLAHWLPLHLDKGSRGRGAESVDRTLTSLVSLSLCHGWAEAWYWLSSPSGTFVYSHSSCQLLAVPPSSCPLTSQWVQDVLLPLAPRCFIIPYQFLLTVFTRLFSNPLRGYHWSAAQHPTQYNY